LQGRGDAGGEIAGFGVVLHTVFRQAWRLSTHFVHGSKDVDSPLRIYIEFT